MIHHYESPCDPARICFRAAMALFAMSAINKCHTNYPSVTLTKHFLFLRFGLPSVFIWNRAGCSRILVSGFDSFAAFPLLCFLRFFPLISVICLPPSALFGLLGCLRFVSLVLCPRHRPSSWRLAALA